MPRKKKEGKKYQASKRRTARLKRRAKAAARNGGGGTPPKTAAKHQGDKAPTRRSRGQRKEGVPFPPSLPPGEESVAASALPASTAVEDQADPADDGQRVERLQLRDIGSPAQP